MGKKNWRMVLAETLALLIYSIYTGTLSVIYEVLLFGSTVQQWGRVRILYVILKYGLAHLCAKMTDKIRQWLQGNSNHWFRRGIADSIAISLYQQPLYIFSGFVMGADMSATIFAAGLYFADNVLLGWIYGLLLNWCRRKIAGITNQK